MKFLTNVILCSILIFNPYISFTQTYPRQHKEEPSHAKWGRFTVDAVKKKYGVQVIDYLHIGRQTLSSTTTQEKFKLWVKGNSHEFGVYVTITFETDTDKVISVQFQETAK